MNIEDTFETNFVKVLDKETGVQYSVPSFKHRTIYDLKNYSDVTKNTKPSLTDKENYMPLRDQIARFFPNGMPRLVVDGYDDLESFDAEDVTYDQIERAEYLENKIDELRNSSLSTGSTTERTTQKSSDVVEDPVVNTTEEEIS